EQSKKEVLLSTAPYDQFWVWTQFVLLTIIKIPKAVLFSRCSSVSATYDIYTKHGVISQLRSGAEPRFYECSCTSLSRCSPDLFFYCTVVQKMQSWFLCQQRRCTGHLRGHNNDESTCTRQADKFYLTKTQQTFRSTHQPLPTCVRFALETRRFSSLAVVCRKS
ncbi:unnamed protein product, partial [Bubo scandiacus]